ncbi:DUF1837 domain-containing protein [Candidatus Bipolaricaulota bacterium]
MLNLDEYIEVSRKKYEALIRTVEHRLDDDVLNARVRFRYVAFDGNGIPRFRELAHCLSDHAVTYCLSARRRGDPQTSDEWSALSRQARHLLRQEVRSGDAGEILLYFLLEAELGAPQLVAKVDLKTNPRLEVNGSDGIHMRMSNTDDILELYFGEAKLYKDVRQALRKVLESLTSFHGDGMVEHELGLVTSHFKNADEGLRQRVVEYIDPYRKTPAYRVKHACLVGFTWDDYAKLRGGASLSSIEDQFIAQYEQEAVELKAAFESTFEGALRAYHLDVFFLPFHCVDEFRSLFLEAVS